MEPESKDVEKVELAVPVEVLLNHLSNHKPCFPQFVSRKLCEQVGLECEDEMFYRLLSAGVDAELKRLLHDVNNTKTRRKKDDEQRTLKTSDVQKLFQEMGLPLEKPHFYPSLGIDDRE